MRRLLFFVALAAAFFFVFPLHTKPAAACTWNATRAICTGTCDNCGICYGETSSTCGCINVPTAHCDTGKCPCSCTPTTCGGTCTGSCITCNGECSSATATGGTCWSKYGPSGCGSCGGVSSCYGGTCNYPSEPYCNYASCQYGCSSSSCGGGTCNPAPTPTPASCPTLTQQDRDYCLRNPPCVSGQCFPVCNYSATPPEWACTGDSLICTQADCTSWATWYCNAGDVETRYCMEPTKCTGVAQARVPCAGPTLPSEPPPSVPGSPTCSSAGPAGNPSVDSALTTYDVYAYGVQNSSGVAFSVWSGNGGQDDLVSYSGTNMGGGTWRGVVNFASHPDSGQYYVQAYLNGTVYCDNANFVRGCVEAGAVTSDWTTCGIDHRQSRTCTETCGTDDCAAVVTEQSCGDFAFHAGQKLILDDAWGRSGMLSYGVPWTGLELGSNPNSRVSTPGWRIESIYDGLRYDYDFYVTRMDVFESKVWADDSIGNYDDGGTGYQIYKSAGDVTLSAVTLTTEKVILLVDGSVTVSGEVVVPSGAFLAVIAKGNIAISPSVVTAQGWFVGENIYVPCHDGNGDSVCDKDDIQFDGRGSFVGWTNIVLRRDMGVANNLMPSEKFTYRSDFLLNAPVPMRVYTKRFTPFIP
jgi:hypothetical protein